MRGLLGRMVVIVAVALALPASARAAGEITFQTPPALGWTSALNSWHYDLSKGLAGDFDGDGKADVAIAYDYGSDLTKLWTIRGNGSPGNLTLGATELGWQSAAGGWSFGRSKWVSGDFDGDGQTDIAAFYNYDTSVSLWTFRSVAAKGAPPAFQTDQAWSGTAYTWANMTPVTGDFDGDGKDDVGVLYANANSTVLDVWRSVSSAGKLAFAAPATKWSTNSWNQANATPLFGDVNGDHRTDIVQTYDYGNGQTKLWTIPESDRAGSVAFSASTIDWDSGQGAWESGRQRAATGDFDGDGRDEVASLYDLGGSNATLNVFKLDSNLLTAPEQLWRSGSNDFDASKGTALAGDFDGDGRADLVYYSAFGDATSRIWTLRSAGPRDSDSDGIPDIADKCPTTARGSDADGDGCPDPVPAPAPVTPVGFTTQPVPATCKLTIAKPRHTKIKLRGKLSLTGTLKCSASPLGLRVDVEAREHGKWGPAGHTKVLSKYRIRWSYKFSKIRRPETIKFRFVVASGQSRLKTKQLFSKSVTVRVG